MSQGEPGRPFPTVTLCVITLNEEANIARCLASVGGLASQAVVVDSGSVDRTQAIARAAGAEVHEAPFRGYGAQKQLALEKATGDWVLCLDADEWIDDDTRAAIRDTLARGLPSDVTGLRLRMQTRYLGRWMKHAGWLRERKLRLVRRDSARWKPDVVHESLELLRGHSMNLQGTIRHEPYRDLADELETIDRYTGIIAERDRATRLPRILFGVTLEPPLVFVQKYVLQLGMLDGIHGLVGAGMTSFYFFLRYAKICAGRRDGRGAAVSGSRPSAG